MATRVTSAPVCSPSVADAAPCLTEQLDWEDRLKLLRANRLKTMIAESVDARRVSGVTGSVDRRTPRVFTSVPVVEAESRV